MNRLSRLRELPTPSAQTSKCAAKGGHDGNPAKSVERTFDALVERLIRLKVTEKCAVLLHKEAVVVPTAALKGLLHLRPNVAVVVFVLCLQLGVTLRRLSVGWKGDAWIGLSEFFLLSSFFHVWPKESRTAQTYSGRAQR